MDTIIWLHDYLTSYQIQQSLLIHFICYVSGQIEKSYEYEKGILIKESSNLMLHYSFSNWRSVSFIITNDCVDNDVAHNDVGLRRVYYQYSQRYILFTI